jgi:hypothetical protein
VALVVVTLCVQVCCVAPGSVSRSHCRPLTSNRLCMPRHAPNTR